MKLRFMIFAAGLGKRMGEISRVLPKPLSPIGDKTILGIILEKIEKFRKLSDFQVVVNCFHLSYKIEAFLKDYPWVTISKEKILLETGGGLLRGANIMGAPDDAPIVTINSDSLWHSDSLLDDLFECWKSNPVDLLMVFCKRNLPGGFLVSQTGDISFKNSMPHTYTGIQIIKPLVVKKLMPDRESFSLSEIYKKLFKEKNQDHCCIKAKGLLTKKKIYHLGSLQEYESFLEKDAKLFF